LQRGADAGLFRPIRVMRFVRDKAFDFLCQKNRLVFGIIKAVFDGAGFPEPFAAVPSLGRYLAFPASIKGCFACNSL